jgi:hypothetical protein
MVGIGVGVPSRNADIRVGDMVVSSAPGRLTSPHDTCLPA